MAAAPHMDPKVLLHRKLGSSWSSPELVALLQTRPGLLSDILCIFRGLEQPLRLRVLLAFLAFDDISVLPKDSVLAVLDEAAADPDEWVKVMAAVVRDWLFGSAEGERPPSAEVAADVLAKCQLLEATAAATAAATGDAEPASMDEEDGSRVVEPEPYFCPIEYLYLSEPIIQRHHRAAPLTRRENEHFAVGDLSEVAMEPISDTPPAAGAGLPHSSSSGSLRSFQQQGGSFSSAGGGAPPAASHRPQPPPQSLAPQAVSRPRPPLGGPRGAASLLGAAQRLQKPRLKVIKLDDVKVKTDHAKVAASNEALSLEFGTQPLQLDTKTASKLQQPAQSAAGTAAAAAAFTEAPDAAKKRSAAEALAGLVAPSASSASADAVQAPTAAEAAGAAASMDPLSDYHRMKAKSNRLTPQDDERIRLFYLHGTQGNPHPEQREVKIKINEEEVAKEDGSRVKETLYISLNYDTRKAVLSRKVSKPKKAAP